MASDVEFDWGDDFLDGDTDFDFDFDKPKNQGFLKSVSTGFLSSLRSNTVGDTDAQIKTLRRLLPSSFGTTFDFYRDLERKRQTAFKEFKENSADLMGDLAFLSGSLSDSLRDRLPNKIVDGLETFSKKDFSDWEKPSTSSGNSEPRMEDVDDDMQRAMLDMLEQQATINVESTDVITQVMTGIGSKQLAAGLQNNAQLYEMNANMKRLYDYQVRIQGQRESMKLNLMTRQYLTSAKYFKFMEAAQHRMIQEIKLVSKNTGMSDVEKTTLLQAGKGKLRDNLLKTTFGRSGGMMGAFNQLLGKDVINDSIEQMSTLIGDTRFASEMVTGSGMSTGELIGGMLGQLVVERGPEFFTTGPGKVMLAKLRTKHPEVAKRFDKTYKELTEFGDTLSYTTKSFGSIAGRHYQETGMMDVPDETYEEYVENLPAGRKPMPKLAWSSIRKAAKAAGGAFNLLGENYLESQGTEYQIKEKSLADLKNVSVWSDHDSRSLTEEIPALLSEIHHSIEKFRTGDENVAKLRYDYRTSRLVTTDHLNQQVKRMITPKWELDAYADTTKSMVNELDKEGSLSESARNALAYRLAREADKGNVFNPYDYIGLGADENMTKEQALELDQFVRNRFGITDEMVDRTQENTIDGLMARLSVPTAEGKALLHRLSVRTDSLKNYVPDLTKQIDLARSLGLDEGLKHAGLITVDEENNRQYINQDFIWKQLRDRINGNDLDLELPKEDTSAYPTDIGSRGRITFSNTPANNSQTPLTFSDGLSSLPPLQEEVSGALSNIINTLVEINTNTKKLDLLTMKDSKELSVNFDPMLELMRTTNATLAEMKETELQQLTVLRKLRAVSTVGGDENDPNVTPEQRTEEREKQSLLQRLRSMVPGDVFNKGVEALIANKPLVLGGLLGGLTMTAFSNPKAAALLAGGAAVATAYGKLSSLSSQGRTPGEDENIYDEDGNEILYASKKNAGDYYDQVSRKVIKSWKDIKGTVIDTSKGASVIAASAKKLAGKIFGPDGRELFLEGLDKVKTIVRNTFQAIDPIGKAKALMAKGKEAVDQLDVYKAGESDPVLTRRGFQNGWYFDEEGNEIKGWRSITGPVYDKEGFQLVSQQDLRDGLRTIGGVKIDQLSTASKGFGSMLGKGARWLQEHGREELGKKIGGFDHDVVRGDKASDGRYEPITHRLDSIYGLIAKHWGMDPTMPAMVGVGNVGPKVAEFMQTAASDAVGNDDQPETGGVRLNSLADKIRRKKEARQAKFQDSVIDIAESMSDDSKDKNGKGKEGGLLGKLLGGALGGTFTLLQKFLTMGLKGFPKLFGIGATLTKGLFSLGKILSGALLGRNAKDSIDDLGGLDGSGNERKDKKNRKRKGGKFGKFPKIGKFAKLGIGGALAFGGDMAIDGARDLFDVEEGSTADKMLDYGSVGLEAAGWLTTASAVAGMAGTSLGGIAAAAAPLLLNPVTLGVAGVALAGYAAYKYFTASDLTTQQKLRMTQYGIESEAEELINQVLTLEQQLENYVQVSGANAGFSPDTPLEQILGPLLSSRKGDKGKHDSIMWFNARFKPVFLMYRSTFNTMSINTFKEYDQKRDNVVWEIAKQVNEAATMYNPSPYRIQVWINDDVYALDYTATLSRVNNYIKELKTAYDTRGATKAQLTEDLTVDSVESRVKRSEDANVFKKGWMMLTGEYNDLEDQAKIDRQFKQPETIKAMDVSDMLPGDKPLDLITAFRLAAYGNAENMPWRIEAVLKLERWMEDKTSYANGRAVFTGYTDELLNAFKGAFRVTDTRTNLVIQRWFNYRFLPVYLAWYETCKGQRGGVPSKVWRTLSATAQYRYGQQIMDLQVLDGDKVISVFDVTASPFENSVSSGKTVKLKRFLEALEIKANEAKLRDPEVERRRTTQMDYHTEVDKPEQPAPQGFNLKAQPPSERVHGPVVPERKNILDQSPAFQNMSKPLGDDTLSKADGKVKINTEDKVEVDAKVKPGDDKGVSLNKEQMNKVIIQQMVKAGYDDPKQIAEMLALTDYETGGYKSTAENMRYTNASRARNIFRKLKQFSVPQIQQIMKAGPVAFANAVYNGWLGNTDGPNDGWLYRGRGLVQLTGKDNYKKAAEDIGVDIVNNPKLVSEDPETMAKTAIWFFENSPQMQSIKEHGDFNFAARGLNGGKQLPGMEKRAQLYKEYLDGILDGKLTDGVNVEDPVSPEASNDNEAPTINMPAGKDPRINDVPEPKPLPKQVEPEPEWEPLPEPDRTPPPPPPKPAPKPEPKPVPKPAAVKATPVETLRKEERVVTQPKPTPKPTLEDQQARTTKTVKETKEMDKPKPAPAATPKPKKRRELSYTTRRMMERAQGHRYGHPKPNQEAVKVEAAMKPETEKALADQTTILSNILSALTEGNEQANRRRQETVSMN